MLKTAAVLLTAFSAACAGYLYSRRLELRVKKIEKILLFLSVVKTEIRFTSDSAAAVLSSAAEECGGLPFINDCVEKLMHGADFITAWNSAVDKKENIFPLKKEDTALLYSFGSGFGLTDVQGQIRNCEMHEELFREKLKSALNEKSTMSRPARGAGFLTAAAIMIIFV